MKQRTRKLLTLLLIAAMVMSLMVPALAADTAQSETPYTYDAGDYTFGKISHPNSAPGQPDGLVDYTGNGTVAVTGTADGADGQGDRGQSYAWAAMAYGDYIYVGTCYAAMGNTLSAMDTVMGHKFDEETMRAELNAIFNGTFFYGQEDGGNSGGVLVKVNVHTGEMTLPEMTGHSVRIIQGAMNTERIRAAFARGPARLEVLPRVDDMPSLLLDTDLCITAGGSTCWELCCLGVPFLTILGAENQRHICYWLAEKGYAPRFSRVAFMAMLTDAQYCRHMVARLDQLGDAQGAARVLAPCKQLKA